MKILLAFGLLISIIYGFPAKTYAGKYKWTVEYEMDFGEGGINRSEN